MHVKMILYIEPRLLQDHEVYKLANSSTPPITYIPKWKEYGLYKKGVFM